MDDKTLALLGDHEAAERLTEAGVLLECPFCGESVDGETEREDISESGIVKNGFGWFLYHQCKHAGPFIIEGASKQEIVRNWNHRTPILTPNQLAALRLMEEPRVFEEAKK